MTEQSNGKLLIQQKRQADLIVNILSDIIEFRNGESGLHVRHIRRLTELLMEELCRETDRYGVAAEDIPMYGLASALHDIGKIAISNEILNKSGKLTREEFSVMKDHAVIGANMLLEMDVDPTDPLVKAAYDICRSHHERYDGSGYPEGLKGDAIPIAAQVAGLADVYDSLTRERVYKKALEHEVAVKMIINGECGSFNPLLLECLSRIADRIPDELSRLRQAVVQ